MNWWRKSIRRSASHATRSPDPAAVYQVNFDAKFGQMKCGTRPGDSCSYHHDFQEAPACAIPVDDASPQRRKLGIEKEERQQLLEGHHPDFS